MASYSSQPIASSSMQPVASSSSQPIASSSTHPVASHSSQPIASSSTHPVASPSSQPLASSSMQPVASPSSQPAASSSQFTVDLTKYLPLYKAILEGNLKSVKDFCDGNESALEASITVNMDPVLHVPVGTDLASHVVAHLLSKIACLLLTISMALSRMASSSSQPIAASLPVTSPLSQPAIDLKKYLPLYKAILEGNLQFVKDFYDQNESALEASITVNMDTALHLAVGTGMTNHIVAYLLTRMSPETMAQPNSEGNTVLSIAAIVGNVQAAKMIIGRDVLLDLVEVANKNGWIPLIEAARHGQKKMIIYLLPFCRSYLEFVTATQFAHKSGVFFVNLLIIAGFYDLALELVQHYESLATAELSRGESLLSAMAGKPSAFPSGRKPNFWQYVFESTKLLVPCFTKELRETLLMNIRSLQLVQHLCKEITGKLDHKRASSILKRPLLLAAELGVYEVVEEIIISFPDAIWFTNEENHSIFHLAVMNRQEKVFNLIFQMSGHKQLLLMSSDIDGNNILHLAGKLAPKNQLDCIPGAALQMQRELQWFKEVEKIVRPEYKEDKNPKGETPATVFTEQHKDLVKAGEKWMKGTASSCSVVAALIATIVFAAAITVPGGNKNNGQPNFYKDTTFKIFSISDALSLSSSIAAIIMFLSILTARYAEHDFLYSLPKRLIWGLFMLFLSLINLMVAFCATVFLVSTDKKVNWILDLVFVSALVPVFMYAFSQFPLLWDLFMSTYRPGIFHKQGARVLY